MNVRKMATSPAAITIEAVIMGLLANGCSAPDTTENTPAEAPAKPVNETTENPATNANSYELKKSYNFESEADLKATLGRIYQSCEQLGITPSNAVLMSTLQLFDKSVDNKEDYVISSEEVIAALGITKNAGETAAQALTRAAPRSQDWEANRFSDYSRAGTTLTYNAGTMVLANAQDLERVQDNLACVASDPYKVTLFANMAKQAQDDLTFTHEELDTLIDTYHVEINK